MTAHVSPHQTMSFKARSLLAFVLEPTRPVSEWLAAVDAWLARSPAFFASKPVILEMAGLAISREEYRQLLNDLALRHIRIMAVENPSRALVAPELPPPPPEPTVHPPESAFLPPLSTILPPESTILPPESAV